MSRSETEEPRGDAATGDAEVRRLLRFAGRRPQVPREELEPLRATARQAWEELVERRRADQRRRFGGRRRLVALAAGLALAALAAFWWVQADRRPSAAAVVASVERLSGTLLLGGEPVAAGTELVAGVELTTGGGAEGEPGRAALRLANGPSLRCDRETTVRLLSATRVELLDGAVYVDSPPQAGSDGGIDVVTPLGTVVEIGTQFEVRLDEAAGLLEVRVREGAVSVRRDGRSVTARLGEGLTVRRDGSVSRHSVGLEAESWQWMLEVAPPPASDGGALDEFLARMGREMGWEVVYASEELERAASSILVSVPEKLRPDESIEAVLVASGLEHELDGRRLIVRRP